MYLRNDLTGVNSFSDTGGADEILPYIEQTWTITSKKKYVIS